MAKHRTDTERLALLQEYLSGGLTKYAFCKQHGLSQTRITYWLRKFGLEDKPSPHAMKKKPQANEPQPATDAELLEELARVKEELRKTRNALQHESLGLKAYKRLVELAEETYGITILKNSDAK